VSRNGNLKNALQISDLQDISVEMVIPSGLMYNIQLLCFAFKLSDNQ